MEHAEEAGAERVQEPGVGSVKEAATGRAEGAAVECAEGSAMERRQVPLSFGATCLRQPGPKLEWCIDTDNKMTVKRHLFTGMAAKEWASQRYRGEVHAMVDISASLHTSGLMELSGGQPVRFSTLAESFRMTSDCSLMLGAYAVHEDDPNTRFVAEIGLTNETAELRIVSGGQAMQITEPSDTAALTALMGVQVKHGNEQTDLGMALKGNLVTNVASSELRLAHTLENGNRLRVSADLQTAAVSFGFDFPF